jgi:hypothetical protein
MRSPSADHRGVDKPEKPPREAGRRGAFRDNLAVSAILAVLLITGPLGDRELIGSRVGAVLAIGVAVAVAAVVQFFVRPRG